MPLTLRLARLIVATCLVVVTWLAAAPGPAAALEPPRPLPGYRPQFVTQTDVRPWNDCLWASGAMLLDKWTNGDKTISHGKLRRLSGDRKGGSLFPDLARAYARLGIKLRFSPNGGERITWPGLLRRLAAGSGAVILGDYSDLPRYYGRWDYRFWKGKGKHDNHAMYIERYDRKHGRVWLMDPLARGAGWKGEWISVSALKRFAWIRGGAVSVALTPKAQPAPFAGVTLEAPRLSMTGSTLETAWRMTVPKRWRFPGGDTKVAFAPADDPIAAAAVSMPVTPPKPVDRLAAAAPAPRVVPAAPPKPVTAVSGRTLRITAALPSDPGAYRATVTLTERRFGRVAAAARDVAVFVPGPRQASLRLRVGDDDVRAGSSLTIKVDAENTGDLSWGGMHAPGVLAEDAVARVTLMVAHWVPLDVPSAEGGADPAAAAMAVEVRAVALEPGESETVQAKLVSPALPGTWALVIDLRDHVEGSFAALGSAPAVHVFEVVAEPGKTGVE